jgi:colanic acid biosynthesis glycosyl transferase WcaI
VRILLINQFFWPDAAATGQFLEDLARYLADCGHEVTVICSGARYADAVPSSPPPPVRIVRVKGVPFARSMTGRALSYFSFFAGSFWRAMRIERPDLVVTMTTPPLLSAIGLALQRLRGVRHYIWEMDLFPDALVSLKAMREGSLPDRAMGAIADYSRRKSDGVIALGSCMQERLLRRGIPPERIHIADNWADGNEIWPLPFHGGEQLRVLYSGNLGLSHDTETILGAIQALDGDALFRFSFAGGGARRKELEQLCAAKAVGNVAFLPYASREDVSASLGAADIGLVSVRDECVGTVVPSKVYGLLAAGRPVLFIGPRNASASRIVEKHRCGWQVESGDVERLVSLLRRLQSNRREVEAAGLRARRAFERHYDIRIGVARIAGIMGIPQAPSAVAVSARPSGGLRRTEEVSSR